MRFSMVCTVIDNDIRVITVVKMLWTHEAHCDDTYSCRLEYRAGLFQARLS